MLDVNSPIFAVTSHPSNLEHLRASQTCYCLELPHVRHTKADKSLHQTAIVNDWPVSQDRGVVLDRINRECEEHLQLPMNKHIFATTQIIPVLYAMEQNSQFMLNGQNEFCRMNN